MKTVRQLLELKGHKVFAVSPDKTVFDASELMAANNVGALLVLDAANTLVGIVTERDFVRKMYKLNKLTQDVLVSELMTNPVAYVRPDQTNEDCMALMTEKRLRHLPVLENSQVIGLLSIGDMVKDTISEKEFVIDQLVSYIRH